MKNNKKIFVAAANPSLAGFQVACAVGATLAAAPALAAGIEGSLRLPVPQAMLDSTPNDQADGTLAGPGGKPLPIYINFDGGTYKPGGHSARTNKFFALKEEITVSNWMPDIYENPELMEEVKSETMACLQDIFAPYDVELTTADPGKLVPHYEAVLTRDFPREALGEHYRLDRWGHGLGGTAGVTNDCSLVPNALVFVFTDAFNFNPGGWDWYGYDMPAEVKKQINEMCWETARNLMFSVGLDRVVEPRDVMGLWDPNDPIYPEEFRTAKKVFRDAEMVCGHMEPKTCGNAAYAVGEQGPPVCPWGDTQNSHQILSERLGLNGDASTGDEGLVSTAEVSLDDLVDSNQSLFAPDRVTGGCQATRAPAPGAGFMLALLALTLRRRKTA